MSFVDPTPHRVSACPVHFIWDGQGRGRPLVRAGFLVALLAFGLAMVAQMTHIGFFQTSAIIMGAVGLLCWCVGHVVGRAPGLRRRR